MKMWRRVCNGVTSTVLGMSYLNVTEVYENGDYYTRCEWHDGSVTNEYRSNVLQMGWSSVKEFLAGKSGFLPVEETEGEQNEP